MAYCNSYRDFGVPISAMRSWNTEEGLDLILTPVKTSEDLQPNSHMRGSLYRK